MRNLFELYSKLDIDSSLICLEKPSEHNLPYFCYPENAKAIGFEGTIMYCFIEPYGDMVFACNPESCTDSFVYPLAKTFEDFLRLIITCGSANPVEQVVWMSRDQFNEHLRNTKAIFTDRHTRLLAQLKSELNLSPVNDPYGYVKEIQKNFDYSKIKYSEKYYEVTGYDGRTIVHNIPL